MELQNPHITSDGVVEFYHLGLSTARQDPVSMFSDVKVVCLGGSSDRMKNMANELANELGIDVPEEGFPNICAMTDRYVMYKAGPVLAVNHGIGMPSLSIVLHEIAKLLHRAGCVDPVFIRVGTCGGLGLEPGTVCISQGCCDTQLRPFLEQHILGKSVQRPAVFDTKLTQQLELAARQVLGEHDRVVLGVTMSTDDFYEEQGRLDGAICEFTAADRRKFLDKAHSNGVRNLEMEALGLAAFTHRLGLRAACIAVVIVNRSMTDSVAASHDQFQAWEHCMTQIIAAFVRQQGLL